MSVVNLLLNLRCVKFIGSAEHMSRVVFVPTIVYIFGTTGAGVECLIDWQFTRLPLSILPNSKNSSSPWKISAFVIYSKHLQQGVKIVPLLVQVNDCPVGHAVVVSVVGKGAIRALSDAEHTKFLPAILGKIRFFCRGWCGASLYARFWLEDRILASKIAMWRFVTPF